ncbi:MAG: hypothetical protein WC273_11680 [Dehalococcoidia bacterium]
MSRFRPLLVPGALCAVLFVGGLASGYVYTYHPARNTLDVTVAASAAGAPAEHAPSGTVSGTVTSVDGGRLVLSTSNGPVTLTIPTGLPVDELVRAPEGLAAGTRVNVGVQSTPYGLVLTGLVAVEGAP